MLSRRSLLACLGFGLVPQAWAAEIACPAAEPLAPHWSLRDMAIRTQARSMDQGCVAVFGDSQIELMRLHDLGARPALNGGFSGIRVRGLADLIEALVRDVRPGLVVLEVGINSVAETVCPSEREAFAADYDRLLAGAGAVGAPVVACSILPIERGKTYDADYPAARVDAFNRTIEAACRSAGAVYEDLGAIIRGADGNARPGSTTDGIHLTPASYALLRRRLEQIAGLTH